MTGNQATTHHLARVTSITLATAGLLWGSAASAGTFYIDEVYDYPASGAACSQPDLNTVTSSLRTAMESSSWTGARYINSSCWPQDFWDRNRNSAGLDHLYSDTKDVSIFAGHGLPGTILFAPHDGSCTAGTGANMRLGGLSNSAGGQTSLAVWLACEVPHVDFLGGGNAINQVRQQLGWLNIISVGDNEPRDVFNATKTQYNRDAWLYRMNGAGGENPTTHAVENRRPVVVTMAQATQEAGCWIFHNYQSWGRNIYDRLTTSPNWGFW